MSVPSLSMISPSLNQSEFIEGTIRSVLNQDYPRLEYLVMDGGSTDGTLEILRRYQDRLRWVSGRDGGQSDALNQGFRQTHGEVIGWINSDDLCAPGSFSTVGRFFADHPEVEWLYGRCPIIDRQGRVYRKWISWYKERGMRRFSYRRLLVENYISQPAVFFRRRLLERVGMLDTRYHYAMDYDLWLRMAAASEPAVLDSVLAYFRVSGLNKMSTGFQSSFAEELEVAVRLAAGRHPFLIWLHRLNRLKLLAAYRLLRLLPVPGPGTKPSARAADDEVAARRRRRR